MHKNFLCFSLLFVSFLFAQNPTEEENPPKDLNPVLSRFAFGSCSHQKAKQEIWNSVIQGKPQLWIWTGDIIYADTEDMAKMKQIYVKQKANVEYQKLLKTCPVIGAWDDHDFGKNNAGKEYPKRKESQKLLLEFLEEPLNSPRYKQEGIYTSYTYGPKGKQVKVILLDVRYHRERPGKKADTLGEAQWKWLAKELKESKAQLHFIVSGIQIVAADHKHEKWGNFPRAKERLFQLISDLKTPGVIFISGDRHISEISKMQHKKMDYPLYDITSSGLTHAWKNFPGEKNRFRLGEVFPLKNFGFAVIDWNQTPVLIRLQIRDKENKLQLEERIKLSDLQPKK